MANAAATFTSEAMSLDKVAGGAGHIGNDEHDLCSGIHDFP